MFNPIKMSKRLAKHIVRHRAKYTAAVVIAAMLVIYGGILSDNMEDMNVFAKEHGIFDEWQAHLENL